MIWLTFFLAACANGEINIELSTEQITIEVGTNTTFQAELSNEPAKYVTVTIRFETEYEDLIKVVPSNVTASFNTSNAVFDVNLLALKVGRSTLSAIATRHQLKSEQEVFLHIRVNKSQAIELLSVIIGWMYFVSWSLSFYPQIYINFKKKSVVGFNFDYLFFMTFGFFTYNTFNMGLYFLPEIKKQYASRHPRSINPVRLNDLFFSMHCLWAAAILITQCIIYDRGSQAVSKTAKLFVGIYTFIIVTYCTLAGMGTVLWLDVLYVCSYVKLVVGVKKYIPQVYMNYKRKSTQGWSIGNVLLDLAGGVMTILQMVLDGHNYGDWGVFGENPTKFGLGLLSVSFGTVFCVQHFFLYKRSPVTY